jgi:hypothetical protein
MENFKRFPTTRKNALDEMKRENEMRHKVYRIDSVGCSIKQMLQYRVTTDIERILSVMTDAEYNGLMQRAHCKEDNPQIELF